MVIRNIIHYNNLHLKEDLPLSTLAARFNLSRSYLSDRLHREVHNSLTDCVTLTRIQFAANLLRYHRYTITQAAQEVGIPVVPYPPVQAHHRRAAVPLRPVESHRGLRDEPAKRRILQRRSASLQSSAAWYYNLYRIGKLHAAPQEGVL